VLLLRDRVSGRLVRFRVTGLYRPRTGTRAGAAAPYWSLNSIGPSGASTAVGYTTYGPLAVAAPAFSTGTLAVGSGSWVAQPDMARLPDGQLGGIAARVSRLDQALQQSSTLPSLAPVTSLPAVLDGTQSDLAVARSLLAICAVLVALLAGAALLVVARLLAVQREGESAMLTARGAARGQLARLALAEALPLCAAAAAAGGLAGLALAWLLATPGAGSVAAAASSAWPATAVVAAGAVVIMLVPVLRPVTPGAARARRGRSAAIGGMLRAGADVALIVLAALAGWELRRYSAVSAGISGGYGVDPVLVVAPALALAGGTVAALRLLPAGGKAGDRLAARAAADGRPGQLADQPPAGPPGRRRAARRAGRRDRSAGHRAAAELAAVRRRSGRVHRGRERPGHPGRAADLRPGRRPGHGAGSAAGDAGGRPARHHDQ
jgi:hypothetical protein